jgi:hypothetical protein
MMKNLLLRSAVGLALLTSYSIPAATLTTVPMPGGMVMPMVAYLAEQGHLQVMMSAEIPQLTPLLVSHPADQFAPGDPWFDFIDPSRQGASFSLRYGFVMDANTDPLPPGLQMWIRKLSGSPELKAYRYRATEPKAWTPIFGTDGATNAMHWNGMMFHPAFTAPPGTNPLTATFELYLLDTATGLEVRDSSSGPLVFNWTNVSDGRPVVDPRAQNRGRVAGGNAGELGVGIRRDRECRHLECRDQCARAGGRQIQCRTRRKRDATILPHALRAVKVFI